MSWAVAPSVACGLTALLVSCSTLAGCQVPTTPVRLYTDDQANRGKILYRDACEGCHAPDLEGGKVVPGVAGQAFVDKWAGRSLAELFDLLLVSMPPEQPSSVSRQDKADMLAFILRENQWPAGVRELPDSVQALDGVLLETVAGGPDVP